MLTMCVIAGVFAGWIGIEVLIVASCKVSPPTIMNTMMAFVGGVSAFMLCTKVWGM